MNTQLNESDYYERFVDEAPESFPFELVKPDDMDWETYYKAWRDELLYPLDPDADVIDFYFKKNLELADRQWNMIEDLPVTYEGKALYDAFTIFTTMPFGDASISIWKQDPAVIPNFDIKKTAVVNIISDIGNGVGYMNVDDIIGSLRYVGLWGKGSLQYLGEDIYDGSQAFLYKV